MEKCKYDRMLRCAKPLDILCLHPKWKISRHSYCIPHKKPRMVRVKAWGFVAFGRCTSASIDRDDTFNKSCTILIDRKHLKGVSGNQV